MNAALPTRERKGAQIRSGDVRPRLPLGFLELLDVLFGEWVCERHGERVEESLVGLVEAELDRLVIEDDDAFDALCLSRVVRGGSFDRFEERIARRADALREQPVQRP